MNLLLSAQQTLPAWSWLLPTAAGAIIVLLLVWLLRLMHRSQSRKMQALAARPLGDSYRFAAMSPITAEQVDLLQYLQQAFPDGAVLFRPRLGHFLSVRSGARRIEARERLHALRIDYLLCGEDGKPLYAFEIDMLRGQDEPEQQKVLVEKNRMLRSAGIRMIRFRGAVSSWPEPEKLRERVLAAGSPLHSGFGASGYAASGFTPTGFAESRMDSQGRVRYGADPNNPWADTKKRS